MSWRSEWNAISARISGAIEAASIYLAVASFDRGDAGRVADRLIVPQAASIVSVLRAFRDTYASVLPAEALSCLERHIANAQGYVSGQGHWGVQLAIPFLAMIRAEFDHAIADHSVIARSLAERAFTHLQRSLIADSDLRTRWKAAFGKREEDLERLGAVHLLLHGVWAFKAHATDRSGRTDLVLGTPIKSLSEAERTAEALVLTEWKRVLARDDPSQKADEAQAQAATYAGGVLGGIELRTVRYLVLVSEDLLPSFEDRSADDVTYRIVNVAVEPSAPSIAARSARRESEMK